LQKVAPECSDAFHDIVECCLTADYVETPEYRGEPESSIVHIADALQKHT